MKTIQGPGVFLAQFAADAAPFNTLAGLAGWAAGLGYTGVQIPTWDSRLIDLEKAAESKDYCDELRGTLGEAGVAITELSTHLQGQLVASHPAFDTLFAGFAPPALAADAKARQQQPWPHCARHLFRRFGVAVFLSMAASSGGSYR